MASTLKNASFKDLLANKIIKNLCETQCHLMYKPIRESHKTVLFTDPSISNGGREGAYVIYSFGHGNQCNLISCQSKQIKQLAKS